MDGFLVKIPLDNTPGNIAHVFRTSQNQPKIWNSVTSLIKTWVRHLTDFNILKILRLKVHI